MCVCSVLFGFQNLTKNISFILNDVHNRAVSPRVRKSLVVKFRYSTLFENNIFFFYLPSGFIFFKIILLTNNEQMQSEEYSSLKNHTKIYNKIKLTSATLRKSATRSMRMRNFLYISRASLASFLFMSKYFSVKKSMMMISHKMSEFFHFYKKRKYLKTYSRYTYLPSKLIMPSL